MSYQFCACDIQKIKTNNLSLFAIGLKCCYLQPGLAGIMGLANAVEVRRL